jgi:hypothetical protein
MKEIEEELDYHAGKMSLEEMADASNDPKFKMQYFNQAAIEYTPDIKKIHRPTNETRMRVRFYKIAGTDEKDIAAAMGLSLPKLRTLYNYELKLGTADFNSLVVGKMIEKINAGESAMIMFYLRCRAKFTPSTENFVEHKIVISRPKEDIEDELKSLGISEENLKKLLEGE